MSTIIRQIAIVSTVLVITAVALFGMYNYGQAHNGMNIRGTVVSVQVR